MIGYSTTTYGQMLSALADRLGDPGNVWWTNYELQFYIREALQTWQVHSQFYSTKVIVPTASGQIFYDLTKLVPTLGMTTTDQDLIQQVQIHLQEPIDTGGWIGTPQFTYDGLVSAIQKRRDQFLLETGIVQTISEVNGPDTGQYKMILSDSIIDVRRAMWKDFNGQYYILFRADEYGLMGGNTQWNIQAGLPTDFSTALEQPKSLTLSPPPADQGKVHLITVNSGAPLNPYAGATILGVPNDFVWVLKFGVLADLLSQAGPGNDSYRADYFESRWHDGCELARITNFAKLGMQNQVPMYLDSLSELDGSNPYWVSSAPGTPNGLGIAGNLIAANPIPDSTGYSMTFDVSPNMILPSNPGDFVNIGSEFLNIILDYAQYLAQIKEGMAEINQSDGLYKNFMQAAMVENDRLRAAAQNFDVLSDRTQRETHSRIRRVSDLDLKDINYVSQSK